MKYLIVVLLFLSTLSIAQVQPGPIADKYTILGQGTLKSPFRIDTTLTVLSGSSLWVDGVNGLDSDSKNVGIQGAALAAYALSVVGDVNFRLGSGNDFELRSDISNSTLARVYGSIDEGVMDMYNGGVVQNKFRTNGSSYLLGGSLGIGTTTPDYKFHTLSTATVVAKLESTGSAAWLFFADADTDDFVGFGVDNEQINFRTDLGDISFKSSDTGAEQTRMTIEDDGDVGIGEINPTARLQVKGIGATSSTYGLLVENSSGADAFRVRDDGAIILDNYGSGAVTSTLTQLSGWDTNGMFMEPTPAAVNTFLGSPWTSSGNYVYPTTLTDSIGIGIATPAAQVEIEGQSLVPGEIMLSTDDTSISGGQTIGTVSFRSKDSGLPSGDVTVAAIKAEATVNHGVTTASTRLNFQVTTLLDPLSTKMAIDDGGMELYLSDGTTVGGVWDNTSVGELGIGTIAPNSQIHVLSAIEASVPTIKVQNTHATTTSYARLQASTAGGESQMYHLNGSWQWMAGIDNDGVDAYSISEGTNLNNDMFRVISGGQLQYSKYGTGLFDTGAFTYFTGVDASGNLLERTPTEVITDLGFDNFITKGTTAGITASVTQSQGNGALTTEINEVSTVANPGDVVTAPSAIAGRSIVIINNGANTLQIFPASGDDLGFGVDVSTELMLNESVEFTAYNSTDWHVVASTEIIHAEAHDEDNTDAFVITSGGTDFQVYHTNGFVGGDLAGWTFDAGGAGTSFPIASIADGAAAGVDIAVTTTGAHGLAIGDIISQSNLADAAYTGVFVVKDIISTTVYEVAAVFTATGTGTMDQAATLNELSGEAGTYQITWSCSATNATNNETFDFQIYKDATPIVGSKVRRKFGTGGDFGSFGGTAVAAIADGSKVSFAVSNTDSAADVTLRNLTIVLIRL